VTRPGFAQFKAFRRR